MTTAAQQWAQDTEQALLDEALKLAPVHGWTRRTVALAGKALGMSEGETGLLLPHGPADLAALLSRREPGRRVAALGDPLNMKIRERIRRAVEARLDAAIQDEAGVRRWMGFMTLPTHTPLAARLTWVITSGQAPSWREMASGCSMNGNRSKVMRRMKYPPPTAMTPNTANRLMTEERSGVLATSPFLRASSSFFGVASSVFDDLSSSDI